MTPNPSNPTQTEDLFRDYEYACAIAAMVPTLKNLVRQGEARVAILAALSSAPVSGGGESTLLDDLAAAQGEIERLREALREFLNAGGVQWMSGMTTSSAWSLPKLAAASVKAHSALTLKSEKAASSLKGSDVGEVGE